MLFKGRRDAVGTIERGQLGVLSVLFLRALNSPLDLENVSPTRVESDRLAGRKTS